MSKNYAVAVLDIGTTGVRMLVGRVGENGTPKIIAKADAACRGGINRLDEYDKGGLTDALISVVDSIKMKTGLEIRSCYVNLRNDYLSIVNNSGSVSIQEDSDGVTDSDIGELLNDASAVELSENEFLVDVIPLAFCADGTVLSGELTGIQCKSLKVDANVVLANDSKIKKIEKLLYDVGLNVDGYIPTFFAEQKVLPSAYFTKQGQKNCFTLVADIGGEITEYTVFYNGIPFVFNTINIGGINVTKDLSVVLNISQNEAERLKIDYPIASISADSDVEIAIFPLEKNDKQMVNISYVVDIMQARLQELLSLILTKAQNDLVNLGISVPEVDRVVLIGDGIAHFSGVQKALESLVEKSELEILNIGRDIGMKNTYSVATGMLLYVSSNLKYGRTPSKIVKDTKTEEYDDIVEKKSFFKRIVDKVKSWFVLFKD